MKSAFFVGRLLSFSKIKTPIYNKEESRNK